MNSLVVVTKVRDLSASKKSTSTVAKIIDPLMTTSISIFNFKLLWMFAEQFVSNMSFAFACNKGKNLNYAPVVEDG